MQVVLKIFMVLGCGVRGAESSKSKGKNHEIPRIGCKLWGGGCGCLQNYSELYRLLVIFMVLGCGVGGAGASRTMENAC